MNFYFQHRCCTQMHFMWKFNANAVIKSLIVDFLFVGMVVIREKLSLVHVSCFFCMALGLKSPYNVNAHSFGVFNFSRDFTIFPWNKLGLLGRWQLLFRIAMIYGHRKILFPLVFCWQFYFFARQRIEKEMDKMDQHWKVSVGIFLAQTHGTNFKTDISRIVHHILFIFICFHIRRFRNDLCGRFSVSRECDVETMNGMVC